MQAVILVGGEGTRLRPLTSTMPKPVVPLVDRPFMEYMLGWLGSHGVDDAIMSCGFLADGMRAVLGDGSRLGLRLRFVEEPEPRGTAGALKYAADLLDERFLMLNGDVLCDTDLTAQIAQHERTGARATLSLIGVEDPSAYGLVRLRDGDTEVSEFLEKPSAHEQIDTNLISAGAYVLERSILDLVPPDRNVSIEREVWPRLVGDGLHGYVAQGYWLDIGTPDRYLRATFDILEGNVRSGVKLGPDLVSVGEGSTIEGRIVGPSLTGRSCTIAAGAHVGSLAVLGDDVTIGPRSIVERAVVLSGARVGADCVLRDCIVAPGCALGDGAHVIDGAVLGEHVELGAGNMVARGARIFPGVSLPDGALAF